MLPTGLFLPQWLAASNPESPALKLSERQSCPPPAAKAPNCHYILLLLLLLLLSLHAPFCHPFPNPRAIHKSSAAP
ncbi:hypothetical protein VTH06DRAFT_3783 [Thermothelomyces fergusii]